jgi:hypothetical protein
VRELAHDDAENRWRSITRVPRQRRARSKLIDTTSGAYYGKGYQDVQNRVPKIDNTRMADLDWAPNGGDGRRAAPHLRGLPRPDRRGAALVD